MPVRPGHDLIDAAALAGRSGVRILDCRARLGEPDWGARAFLEGHLPGAVHADLDRDLAAAPGPGGRHPLPTLARWVERLRDWGINNGDPVVVYDDASGAFAARAWWMLRWAGHEDVALLDGGLATWSGDLETGPAAPREQSAFRPGSPLTRIVTAAQLTAEHGFRLADARTRERWAGKQEPIDPVAGHIPGAVCLPFQDNLDDAGRFLPPADLARRFAALEDPVVCYCGSGVTAAHNVLAMRVAGRDEPYLYPGSWSEWIVDPGRPVARAQ